MTKEGGFDPDLYAGRYSYWLECSNQNCEEPAVVVGSCSIGFDDEPESGASGQVVLYWPQAIFPTPLLFFPPKRCPQPVGTELVRAFGLFHPDPPAAGNALRACVEAILTCQGIRRTVINEKRRRQPLSLHARIVEFHAQDATNADALMAVKWIGNEGSHAGALKHSDVLDALEVIETVLHTFWGQKDDRIKKLVATLNRRKKPRSKRRLSAAAKRMRAYGMPEDFLEEEK